MKPIKTLYLAGPMRGKPLYNFPEFDRVAKLLREAGYSVISPADLDREFGFDPAKGDVATPEFLREAMKRDVEAIMDRADAIALLDGWKDSAGASAEVALAEWCKKPALAWGYYCVEEALRWALCSLDFDHKKYYGPKLKSLEAGEPLPQDAQEFVSGFTMPKEIYVPGEPVSPGYLTGCWSPTPEEISRAHNDPPAPRPKFAEWSIPVLEESIKILEERGQQYGDTYKTCQFLNFRAVAKLLQVALPESPEIVRALSLAVLADIKHERQGGAYKSDNVKDGINYSAAMDGAVQEALKEIQVQQAMRQLHTNIAEEKNTCKQPCQ